MRVFALLALLATATAKMPALPTKAKVMPASSALSTSLNLRGGVSADLATKLSLGSLSVYAGEMWFTEYANNKYSADKSANSANTKWWVRWFQLALVQQVSIMAFTLQAGGDLTALCKANAFNYGLAGTRMILSKANMDATQFKVNLLVMAVMIGVNLSGAGVF